MVSVCTLILKYYIVCSVFDNNVAVACRDIFEEMSDVHPQNNNLKSATMVSGLSYVNIGFSCPSKLVLTGPNLSMCMSNGEREPDPGEVTYKGKIDPFVII